MCVQSKICFMALFAISLVAYGNLNDVSDIDLLKSVEDLQAQVMEIKGQYVSITSSLERIQLEIPYGLQNFPDIFNLDNQNLIIGPDGNIYFDHHDIRDFYFVDESGEKDSDDDGYNDNDEIIHGSDPLDKDDVPLIIMSPDNCPNGYINQQYFYILHTNFKSPVSWYLLEELPPGLTLRENGIIVGIPQETGDFSFLLQVEDESGKEDVKTMRIIIDSTSSSVRAGCGEYK